MEDRKMLRKQGHIFSHIPFIFQEYRCHQQKKGEQTFCSSHRLKLLVKTNYAITMQDLKQTIGLPTATALIITTIIGSGIFMRPACLGI